MESSGRYITQVSPRSCNASESHHLSSFRWEAARDWKDTNPKGTMKEFGDFWKAVQHDADKLQVL